MHENHILRQKVYSLRKQLGRLSCAADGVGPTGGVCLDADGRHNGREIGSFDAVLAQNLAAFFGPRSVLDLGCGLGEYGRAFQELGVAWEGFDGVENIEEITDHFVRWADLTVPQWFGHKHDWVMSLQVGETIPAKYEQAYLENLIRHARYGIVLTWTPPQLNAEASGHGNAKSAADVIEAMVQRGFVHDSAMGARLSVGAQAEGAPPMVFWNKNIQRT
ncbi:hypothetical protein WJX75_004473 [Coccomyxa subellipsoidea]|uniref:S-adenosyl-L-methionine-dependent methyltransferase n=1 Tax=Coccomyxa subellipsoidea TaxID=248742 RepID=A0ABR2YL09_9CHLO